MPEKGLQASQTGRSWWMQLRSTAQHRLRRRSRRRGRCRRRIPQDFGPLNITALIPTGAAEERQSISSGKKEKQRRNRCWRSWRQPSERRHGRGSCYTVIQISRPVTAGKCSRLLSSRPGSGKGPGQVRCNLRRCGPGPQGWRSYRMAYVFRTQPPAASR